MTTLKRSIEIDNAAGRYSYDYSTWKAFREGAEWADKHPHWTSVDDNEPPLWRPVLLQTKGHVMPIIGMLQKEGDIYQYCNQYYDKLDVTVTHWMDIPTSPKYIDEFDKFMEHLKEED
jgi:hypothetical protein